MHAAALMGQLRTANHTLATLDLTPSETLTRLDQVTADLTDDETSATCVYAVHDPATGDWDIARAGHPQPAPTRLHVPRHSTLVLYTDGLIDNPAADLGTAMARLARTLQATSTLPVSQACDTLLAALAPSPADDIAVLMART